MTEQIDLESIKKEISLLRTELLVSLVKIEQLLSKADFEHHLKLAEHTNVQLESIAQRLEDLEKNQRT